MDNKSCLKTSDDPQANDSSRISSQFPHHTCLHIRVMSLFEGFIYRINGNVRQMGRGQRLSVLQKNRIKEAKNEFRIAAKGSLNLKIDCPDSYGAGGSSDTAEMAR